MTDMEYKIDELTNLVIELLDDYNDSVKRRIYDFGCAYCKFSDSDGNCPASEENGMCYLTTEAKLDIYFKVLNRELPLNEGKWAKECETDDINKLIKNVLDAKRYKCHGEEVVKVNDLKELFKEAIR